MRIIITTLALAVGMGVSFAAAQKVSAATGNEVQAIERTAKKEGKAIDRSIKKCPVEKELRNVEKSADKCCEKCFGKKDKKCKCPCKAAKTADCKKDCKDKKDCKKDCKGKKKCDKKAC